MQLKASQHFVKGMQRDLSVSKFNPEYVFDAQNIRITARENNTLLSVTNEKGNLEIPLRNDGQDVPIEGVLLGYCVLNNYVTLFTTGDSDTIYRLENKGEYFEAKVLYSGKLNFNTNNPIETLGIYENENIQKVYWVDGINQTRVINITSPDTIVQSWDDDSFDFVQKLELTETVSVKRNEISNGNFSPGTIQYCLTYYNLYGQETNIFYTSSLEYISFNSRGASPDDTVSNSFTITIKNPDTRFQYIRIYSIQRSSIDATPSVKSIANLAVSEEDIIFTDTGTVGTTVDPTELLYLGGEEVVFKTITQKDNTLFLGNALIKRSLVGDAIVNGIKGGDITFYTRYVGVSGKDLDSGYYPYQNTLRYGDEMKSLKYLEWYRFGIQFQHKTGKWSEPLFVNDAYNTTSPSYGLNSTSVVNGIYQLPDEIIEEAVKEDFLKVRGVIVFPELSDREVVAQGIICPTVFNVEDRYSNSPFAQASWFSRPNLPFDVTRSQSNWNYLGTSRNYLETRAAIIRNANTTATINGQQVYVDLINKGAWAEFRHNRPIPNNWARNAEIQVLANVPNSPYTTITGPSLTDWVNGRSEYYFIDQSIVTFHSPDIEFDEGIQNLDASGYKLRIVGAITMTADASDIDIQTSTPANNVASIGFYKEPIGSEYNSVLGMKNLISGVFWLDRATDLMHDDYGRDYTESFMVYAWHRNGSLNNQGVPESGTTRTAMLDKKKISNLKFGNSIYLDTPWLATGSDGNHTGITPVSIFNSKEQSLVRIPAPENSDLGELNYYGNIDKVLVASRIDSEYTIEVTLPSGVEGDSSGTFNKKDGYPIIASGSAPFGTNNHKMFTNNLFPLRFEKRGGDYLVSVSSGTDPVRIKYKSTPHAVFAFNYTSDKKQVIMPTTLETDGSATWPVNAVSQPSTGSHAFWNTEAKKTNSDGSQITDGVFQDTINLVGGRDNNRGYLWLAELYNDNVENRFGGQTEEAFENNQWLPAGESILIVNGKDSEGNYIPKTNIKVLYEQGDTFIQRYDCLKTYPSTLEDQNSIVEIVSFPCETRINIDGRYDRNRGQISNLTMTPENFNLLNKVYSQKNNFFTYRGLNRERFNLDYFPTAVTWTKEKSLGEDIDTWTNITMVSTLDLDGDKGEVESLNTFKNEIFCFQKQGLSNILFNSRVQIPTSDDMPIEITNGLKVNGKRYISNTIGCTNKWSIVESPSGLYFVDNDTNSLYLFNGEITSLSDQLGFRQWINVHNVHRNWDPVNYYNYRSFYDKNNNDVYFTYKDHCLCYSELLGQFTSFMSYEEVPAMFNVGSDFYAIKDNKLWGQFQGDYNMFFGKFQPFSITLISNAEEPNDKIFNTLEWRSDSWEGDTLLNLDTFDSLEVWNEYQSGSSNLSISKGTPSPLKKMFRVWRANIPRDSSNRRDRIRNTWAYIKLSKNTLNKNRLEFHDAIVHYSV